MNNGMWANPNFSMYAPFMPFSPYPTTPQGRPEGKHKKEGANSADGYYPSLGKEKEEKNSGFKDFLLGMKDGVVDTVKGIFTLKGAAITLGTVFAAWATGGAILIPLAIAGMGVGGYQIIKGIVNHDANKSGRGVDTFLLSLLGLKCAPSEFGGHALVDESLGGLWGKLKAPFKFNGEFDPNTEVDFWRASWDSTREVFQKLGKSLEGKSKNGAASSSTGNSTSTQTVKPPPDPDASSTNNGASKPKKPSIRSKVRKFLKRKPKEEATASTEGPAPEQTAAGGSKKSTPGSSNAGSTQTSARSSKVSTPKNPESNGGTEPETPKPEVKEPPVKRRHGVINDEADLRKVDEGLSRSSTRTTSRASTPSLSTRASSTERPSRATTSAIDDMETIDGSDTDASTPRRARPRRSSSSPRPRSGRSQTSARTTSEAPSQSSSTRTSRTSSLRSSTRTSGASTPAIDDTEPIAGADTASDGSDTASTATFHTAPTRRSSSPRPQSRRSRTSTPRSVEGIDDTGSIYGSDNETASASHPARPRRSSSRRPQSRRSGIATPRSIDGTDLRGESIRVNPDSTRNSSRYSSEASTRDSSASNSGTSTPIDPESNGGTDPEVIDPQTNQQQKTNPSFSRSTWEYIKAKKGGHTQNTVNGLYMGGVLSSPMAKSTEAQEETETEAPALGFPAFPYSPMFPPFP